MTDKTETVEVKGPGRKPGKMKRDDQGRLLKADGTLAKTPGRKKGKVKAETEKKPKGKRGRPAGSKNSKATKVEKPKGKRGRPAGKKNKIETQTTTVLMSKDLKAAIKTFDKASQALVKALSK